MINLQQLLRHFSLSLFIFFQTNLMGDPGQPPGKTYLFDQPTHFSLGYSSKYVWRGLDLVDGPVVQSELEISKNGYHLTAWGNMNASSNHGRAGKFSEIDLVLNYAKSLKYQGVNINYSFGACGYFYPTLLSLNTWELFFAVKLDAPVSPAIALYYDADKVNGWYIAYEARYTEEGLFSPCKEFEAGISMAASIGWGSPSYNDFYYAVHEAGFLDILLTLSFPAKWKQWEITPLFSASFLPNREIRKFVYPIRNYWGGVILCRNF